MRTLLRHWPILLLALWFGGMTIALDRAVALLSERTTPDPPNLEAPAPWRAYRLFADPDSYAWLSYARDLRESPHFRVRFTHMDNAPFGRAVHWAQLPIWSLCAIAAVLETAGIPPPASLELAGRILLPFLGFLFFSAFWLFLRRRGPPLLAALVVLSAAVALFADFHPLRPDHHGFHLAAAAAFVLPLLFSSFGFAPPSRRTRLPFILSGFFGGIALWLGATVFFFTLAAAALAAALAILPKTAPAHRVSPRSSPAELSCDPVVWRLWALSGALTSLFFYLLEYAPGHFSMRLEANHPLYSLSFLGIGECLFLLMRWRQCNQRLSPSLLLHAFLAFAAAGLLPSLVLFGPVAWYIPRSPLMLRLHARHIQELVPLHLLCSRYSRPFLRPLRLPLLPALAALPFLRRPFSRRVLFAFPFFLLFLALFLWQNRWDTFAALASFFLLLALPEPAPHSASALPPLARLAQFLPHALLLLQLFFFLSLNAFPLPSFLEGLHTNTLWLNALLYSALATQFRPALAAPGVTPTPNASSPVLLAPTEYAPYFWYYARIPCVASLYWENLSGNTAAAAAFADPSPGATNALAIVSDRRVSHLLMLEGPAHALLFDDLHSGVFSQPHAAATLAGTLAGADSDNPLPPWLAVDTDLNRHANPALYSFIPPHNLFTPVAFPIRIYSLMPPP